MTAYFCSKALLEDGWANDVVVETENGEISSIAPDRMPLGGATVLDGIVVPGLANAHSHAFHRALRSRTHALGGSFWTWRDLMYETAHTLTPESYFELARAVFAEMLEAGFTAVGEFHYLHHQADGTPYAVSNTMAERVAAAADDVGIRITILDTLYLHGGLDAEGYRPLGEHQLRFSDRSVDHYLERTSDLQSGRLVSIGTAIHSVRAVDPESMAIVGSMLDRPVHIHLSEQPDENTQSLAYHGRTPTQLLAEAGLLSPSLTAIHATHLTPHDVSLLGAAGAHVCLCPTTERDLADGIGQAGELAEAGARLCIGSDSHAVIDPFEEMRAVEMHQRLISHARGTFDSDALLEAGHRGYQSIGWDGGGTIAVGSPADLVCIGTESNRLAGADPSLPGDATVFAATAADVTDVVVAGEHVVEGGSHVSVETRQALAQTIRAIFR